MKLLEPYFPSLTHSSHSHKLLSPSFFNASNSLFLKRPRWPRMDAATTITTVHRRHRKNHHHHNKDKDKIVVIMGATGTGKSKLSIDLATLFKAEIINSDKMQVYKGLDITTNKIPPHERRGVTHHLLGELDPVPDLPPSEFRRLAGSVISDILSRRKLPVLVGGSNSFIHALLVDRFDPGSNVFDGSTHIQSELSLRYNCCFLWVDVSKKVLKEYLSVRVDDMLESGMFEELSEFFDSDELLRNDDRVGLRKAIGVPEFRKYFKKYPSPLQGGDDPARREAYNEAVREIKDNTCQLAKKQIKRIERLKESGWDLQRLDATEAFRAVMMTSADSGSGKHRWSEIWERQVLEPSVKIVKQFLEE